MKMKKKLLLASAIVLLGIAILSYFKTASAFPPIGSKFYCPQYVQCGIVSDPDYMKCSPDSNKSEWAPDMGSSRGCGGKYSLVRIMAGGGSGPTRSVAVCGYRSVDHITNGGYGEISSTNTSVSIDADRTSSSWSAWPNCTSSGRDSCPFIVAKTRQ